MVLYIFQTTSHCLAINSFHATDLFWKPLVSDVFRGYQEISGMKWVKDNFNLAELFGYLGYTYIKDCYS